MNISSYRIINKKFASNTDLSKGARLYGGRWNSIGTDLIYTSDSTSLAHLEQLARSKKADLINDFAYIVFTFDDSFVKTIPKSALFKGWDDMTQSDKTRIYGDNWVKRAKHAILRVPSSVNITNFNYLINPHHKDYLKIGHSSPKPFRIDQRFM